MSRAPVWLLSICMLLTGSVNTIATKLQDVVVVGTNPDGSSRTFLHPAFQTACMFLGESLCLIPFLARLWYIRRREPKSGEAHPSFPRRAALAFMIPALCDAGGTTLLNLGLYYTNASAYQMLRGTLVLFAGALTILILKRSLYSHHWMGMTLITAGAVLVGASSVIYDDSHHGGQGRRRLAALAGLEQLERVAGATLGRRTLGLTGASSAASWSPWSLWARVRTGLTTAASNELPSLASSSLGASSASAPNPLLGDAFVVAAQVCAAAQFIVEEKFLAKYRAPVLLAVGMEGAWGVLLSAAALPLVSRLRGADGRAWDSLPEALAQVRGSWQLQWTTGVTVLSIAFFNFFGVSVTKNLSGASRATIDACRTIFVWMFSLYAGWEHMHALQFVGFMVLLSGTSIYNELLQSCLPRRVAPPGAPHRRRRRARAEGDPALGEPLLGDLGRSASERRRHESWAGIIGDPKTHVSFSDLAAAARGAAAPPDAAPLASRGAPARPLPARAGPGAPVPGGGRARYTMARSVTVLPQVLSPHSLASAPQGPLGESYASTAAATSFVSTSAMAESETDDTYESESAAGSVRGARA